MTTEMSYHLPEIEVNADSAKLLVVDDIRTNIDILMAILSDYDVMAALDGPTALEIVANEPPDVILLDIMMPEMDGYEVCQRIKADDRWKHIPILFITAKIDEDSIVKAFDVGGSDYVTKPFSARELLARVRIQIQYKRALEQLKRAVVTDDLTGILNRKAFFSRGQCFLSHGRDANHQIAAMMIDIDYFKSINDQFGHASGDLALRSLTSYVDQRLGESDLFGRLGGEEFAILTYVDDIQSALDLAESIRKGVSELTLETERGVIDLTVSIGVVFSKARSVESIDRLLFMADVELYQAKEDHRDCVRYTVSDPNIAINSRHIRNQDRV